MYGSDERGLTGWCADIKAALIGPWCRFGHGMERTHQDTLKNTFDRIYGVCAVNSNILSWTFSEFAFGYFDGIVFHNVDPRTFGEVFERKYGWH